MCFRPVEVSLPQICPECGKKISVLDGIKQTVCPFCKAPLPQDDEQPGQPDGGAPIPPSAGAPVPPGAAGVKMPGAPMPPKAPGAPAPPKAPGA
ncbi:MAG: hypothetical protein FWF91_01010 [Coriobacteriia bacterium]|nr:hypothetical protein [Coriobacteriia bacterium]